jgi:hypothetical protein
MSTGARLENYFNGTIAVTSISTTIPGHASWLMVTVFSFWTLSRAA